MVRNHISTTAEIDKYKADIYQMLLALGCSETTAAGLMKDNQQNIVGWFGGNSSKAPVVTAQMAGRLILRNPNQIKEASKLLGH